MSNEGKTRYRWPWFLLALLLLGFALFVLWMRVLVNRIREYRSGALTSVNSTLLVATAGDEISRTGEVVWLPSRTFLVGWDKAYANDSLATPATVDALGLGKTTVASGILKKSCARTRYFTG